MIGNLFNAISISLLSGLMAIGGARADDLVNVGNSWVSGEEVEILAHHQLILNRQARFVSAIYSFDDNLVDYGENGSDLTSSTYWYEYVSLNSDWSDYGMSDNDWYTINYQCFANPISINNVAYYYGFRIGVCTLNAVNGFEYKSNSDSAVFRYGLGFDGLFYPYNYTSSVPQFNAVGIYDLSTSDGKQDGTIITQSPSDVSPYRFIEYLILFTAPRVENAGSTQGSPNFSLEFQLINGSSDINYITGYNNGYTMGSAEGYSNGYAAGLNISHNSSFMGLFSSIADTPLRFIYGLFNFDLFGTSVLVIVLTLLTGIIVFGIVKKFWK